MSVYRTIGPLVTICYVESGVTFVRRSFRGVEPNHDDAEISDKS